MGRGETQDQQHIALTTRSLLLMIVALSRVGLANTNTDYRLYSSLLSIYHVVTLLLVCWGRPASVRAVCIYNQSGGDEGVKELNFKCLSRSQESIFKSQSSNRPILAPSHSRSSPSIGATSALSSGLALPPTWSSHVPQLLGEEGGKLLRLVHLHLPQRHRLTVTALEADEHQLART